MNRKRIIYILLFVLIMAFLTVLFYFFGFKNKNSYAALFDVITAITAVFGTFGIIIQLNRSKKLEEAHLILELNKEFINNRSYQEVLILIQQDKCNENDIDDVISQYLDFFEPLYIMLINDTINLKLIDELFCYRFFSVVNSVYVQETIITPNKEYYCNIVKLHNIWRKYRKSKKYNNEIPSFNTDLSLISWYNCALYNLF